MLSRGPTLYAPGFGRVPGLIQQARGKWKYGNQSPDIQYIISSQSGTCDDTLRNLNPPQ